MRRLGLLGETLAVLAGTVLAGIACCGPLVLQWLGLALYVVGGRVLLLWLLRYELPILGLIALAALVGARLARARPTRWANALLAALAALLAALRLAWALHPGSVMAVAPLYALFVDRQTALLAAGLLVVAVRVTALVGAGRRRLAARRRGRHLDCAACRPRGHVVPEATGRLGRSRDLDWAERRAIDGGTRRTDRHASSSR